MNTRDAFQVIIDIVIAIGSLGTLGTFLFLLKKDTKKQEQIDKLALIGTSLQESNEMLDQSNKLLDEQVNILRQSLSHIKLTDNASQRFAEIENQKFLLSIKPRFYHEGSTFMAGGNSGKLRFRNKGQSAEIKDLKVVEGNLIVSKSIIGGKVEKDEVFNINLNFRDNSTKSESILILEFYDQLKNEYNLLIKILGNKVTVEESGVTEKTI